jgi:UDP-N-acetylmuramyl pentapeptide phosphotransferase/UDP-N-acetylglucosamine-1-phosphate transferase
MSGAEAWILARAAGASFALTFVLARLAARIGWTDAPRGADAARKLQGRAVPAVGGLAVLLVLFASGELGARSDALWGEYLPGETARLVTLALVFLVGAIDDLRPLAPGPKSLAQLVALAPLALGNGNAGLAAGLALVALGFLFVNVLNTFDNADGALALSAALGLAPVWPLASASVAGFLPLNLDAARAANRASRAPTAYLGDAGAFLLALLVLFRPEALGLLVLPFLDLARLTCVRWRAGSRPWLGDRRHLAHRLQARGLAPLLVALVLAAVGAPAALLLPLALERANLVLGAGAAGATLALFLAALRRAPERLPCPGAGASE